nr:serine carboxypeptidase S28 family protein [Tanacetum cinerariifolium]
MACSLSHTDYEVEALVQKLIDKDKRGSSSQTHEIGDVYLTEKELHQLHLDEEALRETLEEQAMDEKAREEKIRQKQVDDDVFFSVFGVVRIDSDYESNDSDLNLTPVMRSSSSTRVEPYPLTPNPVRIIPGPAGIVQLSSSTHVEPFPSTSNPVRIIPCPAGTVQQANLLKENVCIRDSNGALIATNYVKAFGGNVTGCLGDIDNFLKKRKLDQVVAIVKSCSSNVLDDLNVTMKDLSGDAMILSNVYVFTSKPSQHYLNITMKNVVEVFRKDTVLLGSGSG